MQDSILIEGLMIPASIGVYEWEQQIKQILILDITLAYDIDQAAHTDDVAFCINYAEVVQSVTQFIAAYTFFLIERVAEDVAQLILNKYDIKEVIVKVSKPNAIPNATNVAVRIKRTK